MPWLQGNYAGGWTNGSLAALYATLALPFTAPAGGEITAVRWYRPVNTLAAVRSLQIWDNSGSTLLWSTPTDDTMVDNGLTGWQVTNLSTPLSLVVGHTYEVSIYLQNGEHFGFNNAGLPTPPNGFTWTANTRCYILASGASFPTTCDATQTVGVDAFVDFGGAPPPPPTPTTTDLANALAAWLISTSDNTHQTDGLPWLTKAAVDATKTELDAVQTALTEIGNVTDSAGSIVSLPLKALLARYAADITTIESYLPSTQARAGAAGTGGSYGTIVDDVAAIISGGSVTTSLEKLREQMQLTPDPATDPRWVVGATETGTGEGVVTTGADMYRLTVSGWAPRQAELVIGGTVTWLPRLGWWAPIRDGFVGPRAFVDFETNDLRWPTQFMHGAVLGLPPEVSWSCACYQLDR